MSEREPSITVTFGEMTATDETQRTIPTTIPTQRVSFSIVPPYIEHKKGHLKHTIERFAAKQKEAGARILMLDKQSGGSVPGSFSPVSELELTHTIGAATYGEVTVDVYDAQNIELAQKLLSLACKQALNPLDPETVAVNFLANTGQQGGHGNTT